MGGDHVFAGLEACPLLAQPDAGDEQPLAADDAVALEAVGDRRRARALVDGDGARLVEPPGRSNWILPISSPPPQPTTRDDDDGQHEIEEDDERMADRARALRRRRHGFGLKGFGRALRVRRGSRRPGAPTGRRRRHRTESLRISLMSRVSAVSAMCRDLAGRDCNTDCGGSGIAPSRHA